MIMWKELFYLVTVLVWSADLQKSCNELPKLMYLKKGSIYQQCCGPPKDLDSAKYLAIDGTQIGIAVRKTENFLLYEGEYENYKENTKTDFFTRTLEKNGTICITGNVNKNVKIKCYELKKTFGKMVACSVIEHIVYEPPLITKPTMATFTVNKGEDLSQVCKAVGSPELQVKWMSENKQKLSSGKNDATLTLKNVSVADHGRKFICEAGIFNWKNLVTDGRVSKEVTLNVKYLPELIIEVDTIYSTYNTSETINITVKGNPEPQLQCQMLNIAEPRTVQIITGKGTNVVIYKLVLNKIMKKDEGVYKCSATNDMGTVERNVELTVKPSQPNITSPSLTKHSDYYLLQWNAFSKSPVDNVTVKITAEDASVFDTKVIPLKSNGQNPKSLQNEHVSAHHLANLTDDSDYNITVTICNLHSCSKASNPVKIRTLKWDGKNKVKQEVLLAPPTTRAPNTPKTDKNVCPNDNLSCSGDKMSILASLLLVTIFGALLMRDN